MRRLIVAALATCAASAATAQSDGKTEQLQEIEIVADSPLAAPDTGAPKAKVAGAVHTVSAKDIAQTGKSNAAAALAERAPGVILMDVQGNPLWPELDYRGFTASPVQGAPQGLAVYQNGVRINEAWGDVVNWDLIPTVAIGNATILGANPIFGLNAIGGAVTLEMKNGFTWQGFELDARAGGQRRIQGSMQYGVKSGDWGSYLAIEGLRDMGARHFSASTIRRLYGDIGYRGDRAEIHATVGLAANKFGASSLAPVELLAVDPRAVYTSPQTTQNTLAQFALNGAFTPSDTWTIDTHLYYRGFDQAHVDGNASDFQSCGAATLCDGNGAPTRIPDMLPGAPYGVIDRTWTRSRTFGGGIQATNTDKIGAHGNRLVFGLSLDRGWTDFKGVEELGVIQPNLVVTGLGWNVNEPASGVMNVSVRASNTYVGAYVQDTFDVTDRLSVTAGGRFNLAKIALYDHIGVALNSTASYSRFNPSVGATFKLTPDVSAYANYAEANRAPTPLELGCADPNRPCAVDNFLLSDPPLKQVVSRTVEAGLRGGFALPDLLAGKFDWSAGVFRTINSNDILNVPSQITGRGYFVNAGRTRRQGVETSLRYRDERLTVYVSYTMTDATFRDWVQLGSPNHPLAAPFGGSIMVGPGAVFGATPRHRVKAGADFAITPDWKIGGDVQFNSGAYMRGDEINALGRLPSYALVNLRTSYQVTKNIQVYGQVENALNARVRTVGSLFDTRAIAFLPFADPRNAIYSPPLAAYVGAKLAF